MLRGLSVRQPWASLIETGRKSIEIRSWRTHLRGRILIFASGKIWEGGDCGYQVGPMGVTLCTVELVDCVEYNDAEHRELAAIPSGVSLPVTKRRFAWVLRNPQPVERKVASGRLNLFRVDATLQAELGL